MTIVNGACGLTLAILAAACSGSGADEPIDPGASRSIGGAGSDGGGAGSGGGGAGSDGGVVRISAKDFDQSCTSDSDCKPVTEGNVCALCSCPNAAVAGSALSAFESKRGELAKTCPPREAIGCAVDCVLPEAWCSAGTCVFGAAPKDAGSDAD